jgi:pimeloyl-ACP methyl ester carboxylesterase
MRTEVTRVSVTERVRVALVAAEDDLFDAYGLEVSARMLTLQDAPVRCARVLVVGPDLHDDTSALPQLLLVHGAGTVSSLWSPLIAELGQRTVIAVDLPGCGLTDRYRFGTEDDLRAHAVSFLSAVLDALGVERAVVAGTSLGGMYALHLARSRPERVAALVLLGDPAVALPVAGSTARGLASTAAGCRLLSRYGGRPLGPGAAKRFVAAIGGTRAASRHPRQLWAALSPALRLSSRVTASLFTPLLRAGQDPEHRGVTEDDLAQVAVPTLLVWGDADVFQRAEEGEAAARRIPGARFELVDGGHLPWLDDPAGCAALITSFLADLGMAATGETRVER